MIRQRLTRLTALFALALAIALGAQPAHAAKPTPNTALDNGNALFSHETNIYGLLENATTSSVDSKGTDNLTLNSSGLWGADSAGDPALKMTSAVAAPALLGTAITPDGKSSYSIAFRAKQTNADNNGMVAGDASTVFFIWLNSGNVLQLRVGSSNTLTFTGSAGDTTTEADWLISYLCTDATNGIGTFTVYRNGSAFGSAQTNVVGNFNFDRLGNGYSGNTFGLIGTLSYFYYFGAYAATSGDASTLHSNPYSIYSAGSSATITEQNLPSNHNGTITVHAVGNGTSWTGSTTWTASNVSGWSVSSKTFVDSTHYTIVLSGPGVASPPAGATGTLTLTEGVTGSTAPTTAIGTPTLALSPTSGVLNNSQTITFTGVKTIWSSESPTGLFTFSGGTGDSEGTITVTSNTAASASFTNGSATGTITFTDASTGAQATFTVTSVSGSITISHPVTFQTYQRNGSNQASLPISGTYSGGPGTLTVEASFHGGAFATIATGSGGTYSGTLTGQAAGQGTLTVRFVAASSISSTVGNVGIGDVYLVAGQSNAEGRLTVAQSFLASPINSYGATVYKQSGVWAACNDPTDPGTSNGSIWPLLATYILADQEVPVAFITAADGSTDLISGGAGWTKPNGEYSSAVTQVTNSGANGVKAVLWYQGEDDAIAGVSRPAYLTGLLDLGRNFAADLPGAPPVLVFQIGYGTSPGGLIDPIRLATSDARLVGGSVLNAGPVFADQSNTTHPSSGGNPDNPLGLLEARRFWHALEESFYGAANGTGRGPRVVACSYDATHTHINVAFDRALKTGLSFDSSLWAVAGNGLPATVASIGYSTTDTNSLVLTLSAAASLPITTSFGLGSSTAGKVWPLGPAVAAPSGLSPPWNALVNLPAEPFSLISTSAGTVSAGGGGLANPVGTGLVR